MGYSWNFGVKEKGEGIRSFCFLLVYENFDEEVFCFRFIFEKNLFCIYFLFIEKEIRKNNSVYR